MDQPQLGFEAEELARRRRRRGRSAPAPKRRRAKPPTNIPLVLTPQVQTCGFCGRRKTVLGEMAVCDECGGIIVRDEEP